MINNEIARDKVVNELSDDTSRLAFTWLITFADCEGRVHGDPAIVRSLLFPRRDDISIEDVEYYISEWNDAGLIRWYEAEGDLWIWFPNFEKNQLGMRKNRETSSIIPKFTPELLRSNDGVTPAQRKGMEIKGKEGELESTPESVRSDDGPPPPELPSSIGELVAYYENNSGLMVAEKAKGDLNEILDKHVTWNTLRDAERIATERGKATANGQRWGYLMGIIRREIDGTGPRSSPPSRAESGPSLQVVWG